MTALLTPGWDISNPAAPEAAKADQFVVGDGGVVDFSGNPLGTLVKKAAPAPTSAAATLSPVTVSSAQATTWANLAAGVTAYNALQTDVAAMKTAYEATIASLVTQLAATRADLAAVVAVLKTTNTLS